jgi:hypothetical protein
MTWQSSATEVPYPAICVGDLMSGPPRRASDRDRTQTIGDEIGRLQREQIRMGVVP